VKISLNAISINTGSYLQLALFVFTALLNSRKINAQTFDSIYQLKSITIRADKLTGFTMGMKIIPTDSITLETYRSDNAARLLSARTPVYVKTYGQGGLATLSIRGTLATHTGVYWNGVNINQPNLGQTDISLIPLFFFESVALQYGGSSSLFGSGNIGGGLHLDNNPDFSNPLRLRISTGIGSFHEYLGNIKASYGGKTVSCSLGVSANSQENDFPYTDIYHHDVIQKNAALQNANILHQVDIKTSKNSTLGAGLWILRSDRDLPSSMLASSGTEHQQDKSTRACLKWELVHSNNILILRSALLIEKMHYTNPQVLIDAHYLTQTGLIEAEYRSQISPGTLIGISGSAIKDHARIYAYNGDRNQVQGCIVGSLQQNLPFAGWIASLSVRKEWIQGYTVPLCPSLGAEGRLSKNFSAKLHLSGNFKAPTLNDRFWQPGGNENLQPETSWNSEAGINGHFSNKQRTCNLEFGLTAYYAVISNLILWLPVKENVSVWSPGNIQEVISKGLEINSKLSVKWGNVHGEIHFAYSYTPSEFNKNEGGMAAVKGNQLIYIPLHNAVAGLRIDYKNFFLDWSQSLTGKRYVSKDNSVSLDGYTLGNLIIGNHFKLGTSRLGLQGEIYNLFETKYQAIQNYAVPGRSFRLLLNLII